MQFRVLGRLEVERDGVVVDLGSPKQRLLVAVLLLERGAPVSAGRLLDLLWEGAPPPRAEVSLQSYVSNLRRALEPQRAPRTAPDLLVTRPPGYALLVPEDALDTHQLARTSGAALDAIRGHRWDEAAALATAGLALRRGTVLPEFGDVPFLVAERRRVDALIAGCREAVVVSALGLGRLTDAVAEAESWVDEAPQDERALRLLVLSLHRAGRTPQALDRLRTYRDRLAEDTGLEVGRELSELQAALLAQDRALDTWPAAAAASPAPAAVPAQRTPATAPLLAGREPEQALLAQAVAAAADAAQWVVLTGPAGIGKTSLASLAVSAARSVVWARCPDDTVPAWWPLRQLVRALGEMPEVLLVPPDGTDADAARFAVYERVTDTILAARPADGVLALVIDDVQWADDTSLGCLAHVVDAVQEAGVLVVLTLRDDEAARPELQRLLATLARRRSTCLLPVPHLPDEAVAELVERLTGELLSPAAAQALAAHTGGNPLFVSEYARLPPADRDRGGVPVAVRQVLERRLSRLPERVVDLLRTAAVVGEDFDLPTVAAVAGIARDDLAECLHDAVAVQVVVAGRAGGTGYGFAHSLLRHAVLAGLTAPRRQLLHAKVAAVLDGHPDTERLARRAGHLLAAGPMVEAEDATAACVRVARDAERRQEFQVAAQWWEAALSVSADGPARLQLELDAVRALARAGRPDRALHRVDDAFACALSAGNTAAAARLADELVHIQDGWTWTVFGEPRPELLDRLHAALALTDEPAERIPLLGALGAGLHLFTRADERLVHIDEALRLARTSGQPDLLRSALGASLMCLIQVPHALDRTIAEIDELERSLGAERDRRTVLVLQARADLLLLQGRVQQSQTAHLATVALSDALRMPGFRAQERWAATRYAQWHGDGEQAEALMERARLLHEQTGVQYAAGAYAQSLLSLRWQQGRLEEVGDAELELTQGFNHELWQALRANARGDVRGARGWADQVPAERFDWWGRLSNLVLHANVAADLGLVARASDLIDALTPHAGLIAIFGHFGCAGPVDLALGRLHALLSDADAAARHLRSAHTHAVRERGRPFAAQAERLLLELDGASGVR